MVFGKAGKKGKATFVRPPGWPESLQVTQIFNNCTHRHRYVDTLTCAHTFTHAQRNTHTYTSFFCALDKKFYDGRLTSNYFQALMNFPL